MLKHAVIRQDSMETDRLRDSSGSFDNRHAFAAAEDCRRLAMSRQTTADAAGWWKTISEWPVKSPFKTKKKFRLFRLLILHSQMNLDIKIIGKC